jgi:hypothetical protein
MIIPSRNSLKKASPPPRRVLPAYDPKDDEGDGLDQLLSQAWKDKARARYILQRWSRVLPALLSPPEYRINPGLEKRAWEALDLLEPTNRYSLEAIRRLALAYQANGADPGGSYAFTHYAKALIGEGSI